MYARVDRVTRGEKLELMGCERELLWCAVRTLNGDLGWIEPQYMRGAYAGRAYTIFDMRADGSLRIVIFKPHNSGGHHNPHHPGPRPDRPRPPLPEKEKPKPPKYAPMPMPKGYNPLCPMGVNDC